MKRNILYVCFVTTFLFSYILILSGNVLAKSVPLTDMGVQEFCEKYNSMYDTYISLQEQAGYQDIPNCKMDISSIKHISQNGNDTYEVIIPSDVGSVLVTFGVNDSETIDKVNVSMSLQAYRVGIKNSAENKSGFQHYIMMYLMGRTSGMKSSDGKQFAQSIAELIKSNGGEKSVWCGGTERYIVLSLHSKDEDTVVYKLWAEVD